MNEPEQDQDQVRCPECGKLHSKNLITFAWHQFMEQMKRERCRRVLDEHSFAHGFMSAVYLVKAIEDAAGKPLTEDILEKLTDQALAFEEEIEAP